MSALDSQSATLEVAAGYDAAPPSVAPFATGWRAYVELTKPRLNSLVLVSAAVGFVMAVSQGTGGSFSILAYMLVGTLLCASAGAILNQWLERDLDARMNRTVDRPIPSGRIEPFRALLFGGLLAVWGVTHLAVFTNALAALVAFLTLVSYTVVYTPMKRVSSISTLVGAIPGAMPPLIGWAAATGSLEIGAWSLFLIIFVWQMPHFLAIAWLYRDDYRRGGFPLLPVVDESGERTAAAIFTWSLLLVPASLMPVNLGLVSGAYGLVALTLGLVQFIFVARVIRERSRVAARRMFLFTIAYLPLIFAVMVADAAIIG
ncbi:MAG: heme o synthase [Phycisphaerales bacterium]